MRTFSFGEIPCGTHFIAYDDPDGDTEGFRMYRKQSVTSATRVYPGITGGIPEAVDFLGAAVVIKIRDAPSARLPFTVRDCLPD